MPPRGRRGARSTRMDAAIDAVHPLGFPRTLIRKTVNSLLKVYGSEGWVFIEEDSYRVLIEALLEDQVNMNNDREEDAEGALEEAAAALESFAAAVALESFAAAAHNEAQSSAAAALNKAESFAAAAAPYEAESSAAAALNTAESSAAAGANEVEGSEPHFFEDGTDTNPMLPGTRRKRTYGWIKESDNEVLLETGTSTRHQIRRRTWTKSRKSRWDEMSELK